MNCKLLTTWFILFILYAIIINDYCTLIMNMGTILGKFIASYREVFNVLINKRNTYSTWFIVSNINFLFFLQLMKRSTGWISYFAFRNILFQNQGLKWSFLYFMVSSKLGKIKFHPIFVKKKGNKYDSNKMV